MEDVRAVRKGDRNTQQNYQFRGIDAVMNAVGPALRSHGVVVVPMLEEVHYRDVQTSTGKASRECTVTVRYRFHGPAGDFIDCVTPGESMDFGDKGAPKAMSVAYRIALLQALCLPTDDQDPDSQSYERAAGPGQSSPSARQQSPPAAEDTVESARAVLANQAKARQVPIEKVAAAYQVVAKTDITKETDPARIRKFIAHLNAEDWKPVLGEPEPAAAS
jgi:transglutaminase-like putative cysteine protease